MSDKITKLPPIRFSGFMEAWEQRKLGKVAQITMGQSPDGSTYSDTPSEYILVQGNADLKNGWVTPRIWTSQVTKKADAGDLIMSVRAPAGEMGKTAYDAVIGRGVAAIKGNEFIFQSLVKMNENGYWKKLSSGSTFASLNSDNIRNAELIVPNTEEQIKIGEYFQNIDNLITLHQRKLDLLKVTKKSMLQKMFPKDGENVPEIRFAGFTDAWEQCKLEQVSDIFDGTHQTPKYTESGVKFVSVENIATLETMKFISQEAYDKEYSKKQSEKGDILMTRIGDIGTARVIETEEQLAYYVTLALLKPKQVNSNFLAWLISSPEVQRDIWKRTLHIAFPKKINLGEINQVELMVPSVDEQKKIGSFFKYLDNLITLHQRELDLLKDLKKSMLQQMFI